MPPHCDTLDGPVVRAATQALEARNVNIVLPFVPASAESEARAIFHEATRARAHGGPAAAVADRWFFENMVRLHREGEGQPYEGLKPAGLDPGPAVLLAEDAAHSGDAVDLVEFLHDEIAHQVESRLAQARSLAQYNVNDVVAARRYVDALLGFQVWAHGIHTAVAAGGHHAEPATTTAAAAHRH